MGETTKLGNLIDPEVLAAYIDSKLIDNIVFAPLAEVDQTLVGAPGDTIKFPFYYYIGAASDLTEGSAISTVSLNASSVSVQIKEAGKGVEITDSAMLAAYGNPVEEIGQQLVKSMADKMDIDFLTTMNSASTSWTFTAVASTTSAAIGVQDISDALELFGCDIIVSNRLRSSVATTGYDENAYIVKPGALRLILKRNTLLEADRDILRRVNVYTANKHYVTYLYKQSGLIKLVPKTA